MTYGVSIIIPFYNTEKYIKTCIESLFKQDFENIEYIFINDASYDESGTILQELLEQYPKRKKHTKIITHKKNKGIGQGRISGILASQGEYILQIDSDDWCETNMISSLYTQAKKTNADIIVCDYWNNFGTKNTYQKQNYSEDKEENIKKLLRGDLAAALWNKFTKRNIYQKKDILPEKIISIAEDKQIAIRLFCEANKISYLKQAFVHYRKTNQNSLTNKSKSHLWENLQIFRITTQEFLEKKGLFSRYKHEFLQGILKDVLHYSGYELFNEKINLIDPNAKKIIYIWKISNLKFHQKIIYSLLSFYVGFLILKLYKFKKNSK